MRSPRFLTFILGAFAGGIATAAFFIFVTNAPVEATRSEFEQVSATVTDRENPSKPSNAVKHDEIEKPIDDSIGATRQPTQQESRSINSSELSSSVDVQSIQVGLATNNRNDIPISEAHKEILKNVDGSNKVSMRSELESESSDPDWSYFLGQSLAQFVGRHAKASLFSIQAINCRTTICEIQLIGYDESTASSWSEILFDMKSEPWYEFYQVGTYSDHYQGQWAMVTHLKRQEPTSP
mgnify:CR=1 FL=1